MSVAVAALAADRSRGSPVQWPTDNESTYTAPETVICAVQLGIAPITTPAYSPQSNGLSEAFVHTFRRDHRSGADLRSAALLPKQLRQWIADYRVAPHSALGYESPAGNRQRRQRW
jgi:putative transposase